jgi:hypothetical protein
MSKYYPTSPTSGVQVTDTPQGKEYHATGAGFQPIKCASYAEAKQVSLQANKAIRRPSSEYRRGQYWPAGEPRRNVIPGAYHPDHSPDRDSWETPEASYSRRWKGFTR